MNLNKPLGVRIEHFAPESKLVLNLGHKFAQLGSLRESLTQIRIAAEDRYQPLFNALTNPVEKQGIKRWSKRMEKSIAMLTQPKPTRLDWLVTSGIRKLKDMNVVLKQADKNLGLVAIHPHIHHRMVMSHLEDHTVYQRVATFPINDIKRRIEHTLYLSGMPPWKCAKMLPDNDASEPARFYVIPKIHKSKMYACRPIAAQHS